MLASHFSTYPLEAGCDEAGRGCLAGSVYAAAVILPEDYHNEGLNDSKQISAHKRYRLREEIERDAIAWAIGIVTPQEIDRINILQASILAMHRALDQLKVRPEFIIVDGNKFFPYGTTPHQTIVKGDGKYESIACRNSTKSIPSMVGTTMPATPQPYIAKEFAAMAAPPTTAEATNYYPKTNPRSSNFCMHETNTSISLPIKNVISLSRCHR